MKRNLNIGLKTLLLYGIFILVGITITGRASRSYKVLAPEAEVQSGTRTLTPEALAKYHAPEVFEHPEHKTSPLKKVYFEVIDGPDTLGIVYRFVWADLKNPVLWKDWPQRAFRFLYYDFSFQNVSYVELKVDKRSGYITRARYETTQPGNTFLAAQQPRVPAILEKNNEIVKHYALDGSTIDAEILPKSLLEVPNLSFEVASWNHLFSLKTPQSISQKPVSYTLEYLSDKVYKNAKMTRRPQGDYATQEAQANYIIIFLMGILPAFYLSHLLSDYSKPEEKSQTDGQIVTKD